MRCCRAPTHHSALLTNVSYRDVCESTIQIMRLRRRAKRYLNNAESCREIGLRLHDEQMKAWIDLLS